MDAIKKHKKELEVLAKGPKKCCIYHIIGSCDNQLVDCLSDGACKILKGEIGLTSKQYKNLKPHQSHLRYLAKQKSKTRKRKVLQEGGFLPALAAPLLAAILPSIIGLLK